MTLLADYCLLNGFLLLSLLVLGGDYFVGVLDRLSEGKLSFGLLSVSVQLGVAFTEGGEVLVLTEDEILLVFESLNLVPKLIIFHDNLRYSS